MRVAIVGGGTAGLVTAYLLSGRHELTIFERESALGGHVRTLQGNVPCEGLDPRAFLDAGVVEFDEHHFPTLGRLFDELKVERRSVPGTTSLFLADGRRYRSPHNIAMSDEGPLRRLGDILHLLPIALEKRSFERRTADVPARDLVPRTIDDFLDEGDFALWLRMLLMYAYSIPYPETGAIPASLAVPVLRAFTNRAEWTAVRGGTWSYLRRMVESIEARIVTDARVESITRSQGGVELRLRGGEALSFDAVVLAAPPDQVLSLLADASEDETRRFASWRPNRVRTVIHTDTGAYERRGAHMYSEFDLFEGADGGAGYNAYLNRLAGLPTDRPPHYFLAYALDHEIDPAKVVHEQPHHTPLYTVEALCHREEVLATQGERHTFHAGAWLGNGLHEGAVVSAARVAERLGGRRL